MYFLGMVSHHAIRISHAERTHFIGIYIIVIWSWVGCNLRQYMICAYILIFSSGPDYDISHIILDNILYVLILILLSVSCNETMFNLYLCLLGPNHNNAHVIWNNISYVFIFSSVPMTLLIWDNVSYVACPHYEISHVIEKTSYIYINIVFWPWLWHCSCYLKQYLICSCIYIVSLSWLRQFSCDWDNI